MKLRIEAEPEELLRKGPQLLRRVAETLSPSPEADAVLELLAKAEGQAPEQRALQHPALLKLHGDMEELYEKQIQKMLADVQAVIDRKPKGKELQKSLSKADTGDWTIWVAVDLDGTILEDLTDADYRSLAPGDFPPLKRPIKGAADALTWLVEHGARVSVWTARFSSDMRLDEIESGRTAIHNHLQAFGIPFHDIWIGWKPRADLYIDNKSLRFTDWGEIVRRIKELGGPEGLRKAEMPPLGKVSRKEAGFKPADGSWFSCRECEHWIPGGKPGDKQMRHLCVKHGADDYIRPNGTCKAFNAGEPVPAREPTGQLTKEASKYHENEYHTGMRCNRCRYYVPGGECTRVLGKFKPEDNCDLWEVIRGETVPIETSADLRKAATAPSPGQLPAEDPGTRQEEKKIEEEQEEEAGLKEEKEENGDDDVEKSHHGSSHPLISDNSKTQVGRLADFAQEAVEHEHDHPAILGPDEKVKPAEVMEKRMVTPVGGITPRGYKKVAEGQYVKPGAEHSQDDRVKAWLLRGNAGIARIDMPQIRSDLISQFVEHLEEHGVKKGKKMVGELKATQSELHMDKVRKLASDPGAREHLRKPVIVSSDGHILDGHHRWAALAMEDPTSEIPTIEVNLPIKRLIEVAKEFGGVEFKKALLDADEEQILKSIEGASHAADA